MSLTFSSRHSTSPIDANGTRRCSSYYLERLAANGVSNPPDFESAWQAFRRQIIDGLYFWLVNPVELQAEVNNCAVAPRFAMAALDHDTFELMG